MIKLRIPQEMDEESTLATMQTLLSAHRGSTPVMIYAQQSGRKLKAGRELWVKADQRFYQDMEGLIGSENIRRA